jgi:hypothetical protein
MPDVRPRPCGCSNPCERALCSKRVRRSGRDRCRGRNVWMAAGCCAAQRPAGRVRGRARKAYAAHAPQRASGSDAHDSQRRRRTHRLSTTAAISTNATAAGARPRELGEHCRAIAEPAPRIHSVTWRSPSRGIHRRETEQGDDVGRHECRVRGEVRLEETRRLRTAARNPTTPAPTGRGARLRDARRTIMKSRAAEQPVGVVVAVQEVVAMVEGAWKRRLRRSCVERGETVRIHRSRRRSGSAAHMRTSGGCSMSGGSRIVRCAYPAIRWPGCQVADWRE